MKCKFSAILIQEAVPNHFLVDIGNPPKLRNWDWYVSLRTAMNTGRVWQAPFSLSPRTVEDISSISCRTWDFGLYAHATCRISGRQAEELQRKALAGRETQLGADHPETLESISHLAVVLEELGKLDEAGLRSLGWREVAFLEPEGKAWMLPCFPLFLDSNFRVIYCPWNDVTSDSFMHSSIICWSDFCLYYTYLLLFPTPPDHVPAFSKNSWSIVTLHQPFKRVRHVTSEDFSRFTIAEGNCMACEVTLENRQHSDANPSQWRPMK